MNCRNNMAAASGKGHDRHSGGGDNEIMSIGELGRRVSTKVNTIRFYEEIGLLPAAERSASGRRRFTQLHLQRLRFVRNARSLGFSTNEIRRSEEHTSELQSPLRNSYDVLCLNTKNT